MKCSGASSVRLPIPPLVASTKLTNTLLLAAGLLVSARIRGVVSRSVNIAMRPCYRSCCFPIRKYSLFYAIIGVIFPDQTSWISTFTKSFLQKTTETISIVLKGKYL
jgi:hypothetical protein